MKTIRYFLTAIMIASAIISYATTKETKPDGTNQQQKSEPKEQPQPEETPAEKANKAVRSWNQGPNKDFCNKLKKTFGAVTDIAGFTKKEFEKYDSLSLVIINDIATMSSSEDYSTEIPKNNIKDWYSLCGKMKKALEKGNIEGIQEPNLKSWTGQYEALYNAYNELYKEYNKEYTAKKKAADDLIKNGVDWATYSKLDSTYNSEKAKYEAEITDLKQSIASLNDTVAKYKKERDDCKAISDSLTNIKGNMVKAFEVCVFFPLAVKYNKDYVDYAYAAAEEMINSNLTEIAPEMKSDWKKYGPLLKNYGVYNEEVIAFVKYCEKEILENKGKLSANDINYYKGKIGVYMPNYSNYYNTDVRIVYLDDVITELFNWLNSAANNNIELDAKMFKSFINRNLK